MLMRHGAVRIVLNEAPHNREARALARGQVGRDKFLSAKFNYIAAEFSRSFVHALLVVSRPLRRGGRKHLRVHNLARDTRVCSEKV